jgi:TRAP transporter 4TM/12TM fusion protein
MTLGRMADLLYVFPHGFYGRLMTLFTTLIAAFLAFGAFLQVSRAGDFLTATAHALMGRFRGGPAKVAELASSFFGSINGSGIANVALTGPVTIPLMVRVGYKPYFAAAVEAVASNGGQIMPPVLGIAAFIMMDFLEVSYLTIIKATLIPAILYYVALFLMLDFEAARTGLTGLPREELPLLRNILRSGWLYLVPIAVLVILIAGFSYTPETACIYSLVLVIVVTWFMKGKRMGLRELADALEKTGGAMPSLGVVIAMVSILVASLDVTGLGVRVTGGLVELAGGNLLFLLSLTAVAAMILGMGMPASGVYIIVAILLAPSLVQIGVEPLVAHMFVWYYGLTAMLTPPVCLTAFVAASIAGSPFMKTGWLAMRLGIVIFIVPFMFVYSPELIMIGAPGEVALQVTTALIGVVFLSAGIVGYLFKPVGRFGRAVFLGAGLTMIIPGLGTDIIGFAGGSLMTLWQLVGRSDSRRPDIMG